MVDAFAHRSHPEVSRPDALGHEVTEPGVCGRSDDGGREEFPESCPNRVSRSRTRSSKRTIIARCSVITACSSAIVARRSPTSACKVAVVDGITHQSVEGNLPGTLTPP